MKGKSPCQNELNLFEPVLKQIIDHYHPLAVMADIFPWRKIESEYSSFYSVKGAPSKPVRLMAGLVILKHIFHGSDEGIVTEWKRDVYFQYFCGQNLFINKLPCDPSDMAHFRKRIGRLNMNRLLELSAIYQRKAKIGRLQISDIKPGQENFSYSENAGLYQNILRSFSGITERLSRILLQRTT